MTTIEFRGKSKSFNSRTKKFKMAAATRSSALLKTCRRILSEVRKQDELTGSAGKLRDSEAAAFVMNSFRSHQTTDLTYCKAEAEMTHLAETYETYLVHQRLWRQVHEEYHTKGERSVEETAKLVGFKLPHDPK